MEKKRVLSIGALIIGSAIIWGAVILGCSFALKGTGCYKEIQNILTMGTTAHLILIMFPIAVVLKNTKKENKTDVIVKE